MTKVSSLSSPAASAIAADSSSCDCINVACACANSFTPCFVNVGFRVLRSNKDNPKSTSKLAIAWLTTDCAFPNFRAAAEKEPSSAQTIKVLSCCRLNISIKPMVTNFYTS